MYFFWNDLERTHSLPLRGILQMLSDRLKFLFSSLTPFLIPTGFPRDANTAAAPQTALWLLGVAGERGIPH